MRVRIKYWYALTGANALITIVGAAGHALGAVLLGLAMTYGCWSMAEYLLTKELKETNDAKS